ncbi:MAG TPA: hypothetical protein PKY87_13175 [Terricaulis sp.]|nr:hypothetical protein [Terricaulis sp.]
MELNDSIILGGAILAIVLGVMRAPKDPSYIALFVISGWPCFNLGLKNGWNFATVAISTAVIFAIYLALRWAAARFAPKKA